MTVDLLNSMFNFSCCLTSFIVCVLGYCFICISCIFFVFAVVVNLLCNHCGRVSFTVVFCVLCFD
jgi:hypothetical protein